jgi:hypothetical protein
MDSILKHFLASLLFPGLRFAVRVGSDTLRRTALAREMDAGGMHLTIYQPQVDQWKKKHLEARAAVTVTRPGKGMPLYGIP